MYSTTQSFTQAHTIFGGGYVPEQHIDETHWNLPPAEQHEPVLDFNAVIKALRSALSLH
jgi:hypothetical protein